MNGLQTVLFFALVLLFAVGFATIKVALIYYGLRWLRDFFRAA